MTNQPAPLTIRGHGSAKTRLISIVKGPNTWWAGFWRWHAVGILYLFFVLGVSSIFDTASSPDNYSQLQLGPALFVAVVRFATQMFLRQKKPSAANGDLMAYIVNLATPVATYFVIPMPLLVVALFLIGAIGLPTWPVLVWFVLSTSLNQYTPN